MPNEYKILRPLLVYRYLMQHSDEEHPVTTTAIIDMLEKQGISCNRKTVYSYIDALNEVGCDIMLSKDGKCRGYFIASREFELPEVMLLVDAVSSAGFITPKKTLSLIEKLKSLVSEEQANSMVSQVYVDSRSTKCSNEEIYIIIDHLHDAIMRRKKVRFTYRRRSIDVYNKKKHTEKSFTVSPYALIWKDDHYYLVCNNDKYDNLMNLRIDRMKGLVILKEDYRHFSEVSPYKNKFDTRDYSSKMFNMFSGEVCDVRLKCSLNLQEEMLDRFGASIPLTASDPTHFETVVRAAVSDGLVSWIMQYGDDIEVMSPPKLIEMIKNKADSIINVYN